MSFMHICKLAVQEAGVASQLMPFGGASELQMQWQDRLVVSMIWHVTVCQPIRKPFECQWQLLNSEMHIKFGCTTLTDMVYRGHQAPLRDLCVCHHGTGGSHSSRLHPGVVPAPAWLCSSGSGEGASQERACR